MQYPLLSVKVWGEAACFTRPEMKVERVSYPVMTPSAARGVLEAIFWKPEFTWRVREIHVLKPIEQFSIMRNEVSVRMSPRSPGIDVLDCRVQRHTLGLRDVAYVIFADLLVKPGIEDDPAKFRDQFRRRVSKGQCFHRPYLGCREFAADFGPADVTDRPIADDDDLGRMLFDLDYAADRSGRGTPRFFYARLEGGILRVPQELYVKEV